MTNLVRFDPWGMLRDFDRMFEEGTAAPRTWAPRIDVFTTDEQLTVRTAIPGVDAEDIEITVEGDTLTISGSRSFSSEETEGTFQRRELVEGEFKRTVLLPDGVDPESVTATSKNGILEISVPKRPEVLPRKVTVDIQR
jgi:HSP20 family protein